MGGGTEKARPRVVHVLERGMLAAQARPSQDGPGVPAETVDPRRLALRTSSTEARRCDGAIAGDEGVAGRTKDRADVAALSEHLGLKDLVSLHRNARFLASGPGEGFRGRSPWHARRVLRPTTMPCGRNENSHTGSGLGRSCRIKEWRR